MLLFAFCYFRGMQINVSKVVNYNYNAMLTKLLRFTDE